MQRHLTRSKLTWKISRDREKAEEDNTFPRGMLKVAGWFISGFHVTDHKRGVGNVKGPVKLSVKSSPLGTRMYIDLGKRGKRGKKRRRSCRRLKSVFGIKIVQVLDPVEKKRGWGFSGGGGKFKSSGKGKKDNTAVG